jgi:hypothetical protein
MSDEQKKRSIHVYTAKPSSDNDETRVWEPDGEFMVLKNHQGGYFTHAYRGSKDLDLSGVMAGRGKGFASFAIEEGEDEAGRELIQEWRQGRIEVIVVYREWKQEEGIWENKKTVVLWGYIANANLQAGPSSMGIEVHCVRHEVVNDALGTRDYAIDCITGASTIKGGSLGARMPVSIAPPGTPESEDWGEPLEAA